MEPSSTTWRRRSQRGRNSDNNVNEKVWADFSQDITNSGMARKGVVMKPEASGSNSNVRNNASPTTVSKKSSHSSVYGFGDGFGNTFSSDSDDDGDDESDVLGNSTNFARSLRKSGEEIDRESSGPFGFENPERRDTNESLAKIASVGSDTDDDNNEEGSPDKSTSVFSCIQYIF